MGPPSRHHSSCTEPSSVSAHQLDFDSGQLQLPHSPRALSKRPASKHSVHTHGCLGKRRKKSHSTLSISCSCAPLPLEFDMMSRSWSHIDLSQPLTPPAMPSPATNRIEHGMDRARRPSQVGEFIERLSFKLHRLFGNRKGSTGDASPSRDSTGRRSSSTSLNLHGPAPNLECHPEHPTWNGQSRLPNVSEYFDAIGEVGPSSFYNTADWVAFQETFQAGLHSPTMPNGNRDQDSQNIAGICGSQDFEFEPRMRKDSHFSFSDILKSRRPSKDKGKGRMVMGEAARSPQEEAPLLSGREPLVVTAPCLAQIGVLPRVSTEAVSPLTPKETQDIPQAEFTSLEHHPFSSTQTEEGRRNTNKTTVRQISPCHAISPFLWLQEHSASPASSVSSVDIPLASIRPEMSRRIAQAIAPRPASDSSVTDSKGHSVPILIPSNHSSRRSSSVIHGSARMTTHLLSPTPSETSLPSSTSSSSASLVQRDDQTDTIPSTPSLQPALASSPLTMQMLSLGPPKHDVHSPWESSEDMFRMSCESLDTGTGSLDLCSLPSPAISAGLGGSSNIKHIKAQEEEEEDQPDFSITHPAPLASVQANSSQDAHGMVTKEGMSKGGKGGSRWGEARASTCLEETRWWEDADEEERERLYM
ncbi:hypothetical protein ACJBU6_02316 [Exserohilum turcicum]